MSRHAADEARGRFKKALNALGHVRVVGSTLSAQEVTKRMAFAIRNAMERAADWVFEERVQAVEQERAKREKEGCS